MSELSSKSNYGKAKASRLKKRQLFCPYCEKSVEAIPRKKRTVGDNALSVLKLWRDACFEITGVRSVIRKSNEKYEEVCTLFKSKKESLPKKEIETQSEKTETPIKNEEEIPIDLK